MTISKSFLFQAGIILTLDIKGVCFVPTLNDFAAWSSLDGIYVHLKENIWELVNNSR